MSASSVPRRSFLTRAGAAVAAFGAAPELPAFFVSDARTSPESDLDAWLAGQHGPQRVLYDCTTPAGDTEGILFSPHFTKLSQDKLGTQDTDIGQIASFRHHADAHGYKDTLWAKDP